MQTCKQAEVIRISNALQVNMGSLPKETADKCAKRIVEGNWDLIPLSWRRAQKEILVYAEECTISYDLVSGEIVKCKRSDMDLYLNPVNMSESPIDID
jgi:hypothetical protein